MGRKPSIPRRLEKALFQEVNSKCPICGAKNVSVLEVHHIIEFARVQRHDAANMVVLCANCHARAQRLEISPDEIFALKKRLAEVGSPDSTKETKKKATRHVSSVSGIIAAGRDIKAGRDIVVKVGGRRKSASRVIVPGTVAEDKWKLGYLKYLGHKFNDFKEWEMKKKGEKMQYFRIWTAYRNKIKFNVEQTPLEAFERAANWLKERIDGTVVGRIRKSQGKKLYRNFPEYVEYMSGGGREAGLLAE